MDRECTHKAKRCICRTYLRNIPGARCLYGPVCVFEQPPEARGNFSDLYGVPEPRAGKEIMADFVKSLSDDEKKILKTYLKEKSGG